MSTLRPCPKCGEKDKLYYIYKNGEEPPKKGVVCDECGFEILTDDNDDADVDWLWNSRGDKNALRPCPFCGGEAKTMHAPESWVECTECHAMSAMHTMIEKAIEEWNRRTTQ